MGPMLSGNLPAATSPSRNFTTFSPIRRCGADGLEALRLIVQVGYNYSGDLLLRAGYDGVPSRSRGLVMGMILAWGGRPISKISCIPTRPSGRFSLISTMTMSALRTEASELPAELPD